MSYIVTRGFPSLTARNELYKLFKESCKEEMVLFVLSDCDPEGIEIFKTLIDSMNSDFGIHPVTGIKVALTREQAINKRLPVSGGAKKSSTRYSKYFEKNKDNRVWELDAMEPDDLTKELEIVIRKTIDMELFIKEVKLEQEEIKEIIKLKKSIFKIMKI